MKKHKIARLVAVFGIAFVGLIGVSVNAQANKPTAGKPLTMKELEILTSIASINMCVLSQAKVEFDTAITANVLPIVSYIKSQHGSMVDGIANGKPLTESQLGNGISIDIIGKTGNQCQKELAPDYKAKFDEVVNLIKSQQKKAQ